MINNDTIEKVISENRNELGQLNYKAVKLLNENGIYLIFRKEGISWKKSVQ